MKTLRIKPETIKIDALEAKVRAHFASYKITQNNPHEINIAMDDSIGCKLILTKKRLMINGTFATPGKMILAVCVLLLGGIMIPMIVYLVKFKPRFEAMEKEVQAYIQTEFSEYLM